MKHKHANRGKPKKVSAPMSADDPDAYPSLVRYLQSKGKVRLTTTLQLRMAKRMYIHASSTEEIAATLRVEPAIVQRWALCFGWDEERDRRLFDQFRTVSGVDKMYQTSLTERHERIAGGIEHVTERILQKHANGEEGANLTPRDLKTLASTLKDTQEIRRSARGVSTEKKTVEEKNMNINVSVTGNEKIAKALVDAIDRPRLIAPPTKTIAVGMEDAIGHDTDLEASYELTEKS
jgi:hypothetical protein